MVLMRWRKGSDMAENVGIVDRIPVGPRQPRSSVSLDWRSVEAEASGAT